ncbi:MAG: DUF362 domain-containing protein [Anaerolineae bacterium]|jgi:uncharacterized protein (DUF362 family)/NAD-dependent dihydropyrimidine dehydrogenase PreA subunit
MPVVSIVKCETYESDQVRQALVAALEPLGGIDTFVQPGQRVLLKPNLLMPIRPERAITTHPAVVEAMAELVRDAGGEAVIFDSSAVPTGLVMRRVYRDTGMAEAAERTGAELGYDATAVQVSTPDGVLLKRLDLLKICQDVDVVISLPKLKTHGLTTLTGAVKNLFGLVPGMMKPAYHAKLPDVDAFCDMLLDIAAYVHPALTVMDGVVGLEGNGPSTQGIPRQVGALVAGTDTVAIDAVVCLLIGLSPEQLPLFRAAARRGWWPMEIAVTGTPVTDLAVSDFRLPETARSAKGRSRLSSFVNKRTRLFVPFPVPQEGRCTVCRTCERVCPVQAISIVDKLARVDYDTCIRCYCCHEMCPEAAIDLESSRLERLLRRIGLLGRSA